MKTVPCEALEPGQVITSDDPQHKDISPMLVSHVQDQRSRNQVYDSYDYPIKQWGYIETISLKTKRAYTFSFPNRYFSRVSTEAGSLSESDLEEIVKTAEIPPYYGRVGQDPEVFVSDKKSGVIIPAYKFLGSKDDSRVFWDGFQAEFVTNGESCLERNCANIQQALIDLKALLPTGAQLLLADVVTVPQLELQKAELKHVQLGCQPSRNAYDIRAIPPGNPRLLPYRFAGGHIHFELQNTFLWPNDKVAIPRIVKALDAILGVASVSLFQGQENPIRRQYYGLPGEYRLPNHGLEYRTLSNLWLQSPPIYYLTFELARMALAMGIQSLFTRFWKASEEDVVNCIGRHDVKLAQKIIKANSLILEHLLLNRFSKLYAAESERPRRIVSNTMQVILNGAQSYFDFHTDLRKWFVADFGYGPNWSTTAQRLKVNS